MFDHTLFFSQLTSHCPQPLQVLRQRQLSAPGPGGPGGLQLGGPGPGPSLYGSGSGAPSSSSWPTNPIHIKQEIQIPQVRQPWPLRRGTDACHIFRFPHWPVHLTAVPVQAWCQAMWAYSQGKWPVPNSSLSLRSTCNNSNCSNSSNNNNNKPNYSSSNSSQTRQRVFSGRSAPAPAAGAGPAILRMSTR